MSASKAKEGYALLADVVGSTAAADFTTRRDRRLGGVSKRHQDRGWIRAPYTVTAWDEFQTYLFDPRHLPRAILELRQSFAPWELKVGVGQGGLHGIRSTKPINESVGGEAFENARTALAEVKSGSGEKYRRLTRFRLRDPKADRVLNLIYGLHDTLVQDVTERQWETIGLALDGTSHEAIARALGVTSASTVTRNLQRGHYWQMIETISAVEDLLTA